MARHAPRDASLRDSLASLPHIQTLLRPLASSYLADLCVGLDCDAAIKELLQQAIQTGAAGATRGRVIRDGYDAELDELWYTTTAAISYSHSRRANVNELASPTYESATIGSTVSISVTNAHADRLPEDYRRRQTLRMPNAISRRS
jgi:DNA mismatch repair protein MutS